MNFMLNMNAVPDTCRGYAVLGFYKKKFWIFLREMCGSSDIMEHIRKSAGSGKSRKQS